MLLRRAESCCSNFAPVCAGTEKGGMPIGNRVEQGWNFEQQRT